MFRLLAALLLLLLPVASFAAQRVIILAPAAADIIEQLGAGPLVVGKTRNVLEFPQATQVGSHIRPNLEIITSLRPNLLIISSNRFFSKEMATSVAAEVFHYQPNTLEEILTQTLALGEKLGREEQARKLVAEQRRKLQQLQPLAESPRVLYEITEAPLTIAGGGHILADIIRRAGGELVSGSQRRMLRFNPEAVLSLQPDIYLWQVGPMNQRPTPAAQRGQYRLLKADFRQVDQLQYSRANSKSFDNTLELNSYFRERK